LSRFGVLNFADFFADFFFQFSQVFST
jgi:hypothetical protein